MEVQVETDQRGRGGIVLGIGQLVDVDRKNRDLVTMRLVAGRRTWTAITVGAEIGSALDGALGISFFFTSPASLGSALVPGGMLNTTQCHQPLPVGASGS
jgi:hypothetical protein